MLIAFWRHQGPFSMSLLSVSLLAFFSCFLRACSLWAQSFSIHKTWDNCELRLSTQWASSEAAFSCLWACSELAPAEKKWRTDDDEIVVRRSFSVLPGPWVRSGTSRILWRPWGGDEELIRSHFRLYSRTIITVWQLRRYLPSTVLSRWRKRRSISDQFSTIVAASRAWGIRLVCTGVRKVRGNVSKYWYSRVKPYKGCMRR